MPVRARVRREEEIELAEEEFAPALCATSRDPGFREFTRELFGPGTARLWDDLPMRLWSATRKGAICSGPEERAALGRLVLHLEREAPRVVDLNPLLPSLARVAELQAGWLRPLEEWRAVSPCPDDQFSELLRHQLAWYPVPGFMDSLFLQEVPGTRREWFLHVGRGGNLRTAPALTARLTSRMAHFAMEAHDRSNLASAIRYGQILGLSGLSALALTVARTSLGRYLGAAPKERWILEVLQWLVNHPELEDVEPVLDLLMARWRLEPGFSMKGRSTSAVLSAMESWHRELQRQQAVRAAQAAVERAKPAKPFRPSGYRPGRWEMWADGRRSTWTIAEILDPDQLFREGAEMKHCVGNYEHRIRCRQSGIWSLTLESPSGFRGKMLTVEVHPASQSIVQARGKCNRMPNEKEREILERWACENGLTLQV